MTKPTAAILLFVVTVLLLTVTGVLAENLNELWGSGWSCKSITAGEPIYNDCIKCDFTTQDFFRDTPRSGHCVLKKGASPIPSDVPKRQEDTTIIPSRPREMKPATSIADCVDARARFRAEAARYEHAGFDHSDRLRALAQAAKSTCHNAGMGAEVTAVDNEMNEISKRLTESVERNEIEVKAKFARDCNNLADYITKKIGPGEAIKLSELKKSLDQLAYSCTFGNRGDVYDKVKTAADAAIRQAGLAPAGQPSSASPRGENPDTCSGTASASLDVKAKLHSGYYSFIFKNSAKCPICFRYDDCSEDPSGGAKCSIKQVRLGKAGSASADLTGFTYQQQPDPHDVTFCK